MTADDDAATRRLADELDAAGVTLLSWHTASGGMIRGRCRTRPVAGWDYRDRERPWDVLGYFHTGTGGGDGAGTGERDFHIDSAGIPEAARRALMAADDAIDTARARAGAVSEACDRAADEARSRVAQELDLAGAWREATHAAMLARALLRPPRAPTRTLEA